VGRDFQRTYGQDPQVVITMPILEGLDGVEKMSKSLNNYVGINEPADEMFGKIMSVSDKMMWRYYELLTDADYKSLKKDVESGKIHPKKAKVDLAKKIITDYHSEKAAKEAEKKFETVFAKKEIPEDIEEFTISKDKIKIIDLVLEVKFAASTSEARRLVKQNAVSIDGKKISDINEEIALNKKGKILKVGKRRLGKILKK
jgi:tyrosyl-tRNA synthetase